MSEITRASIQSGMKAGKPIREKLERITKDPMRTQREFLKKILEDNKDTEYGKKYNFAEIDSIDSYRKNVPLSTYDTYVPYIERMSQKGERNLITSYELALYNKSSGTVGIPKKVPMTTVSRNLFMSYVSGYEMAVMAEAKPNLGKGRRMSVIQPNENLNIQPDGLPYAAFSDTAVLASVPYWEKVNTSPKEANFASPGTNTRYLHARFALVDPDTEAVTFSFCSFALEVLRYIEDNWELLVEDIRKGTIDSSIDLADGLREIMEAKVKPIPERAKELRAIFEQGFDEPFIPKVWPNMQYFNGAVTGTFKEYWKKCRERYTGPTVSIFSRGVASSEGIFSEAFEFDNFNSVIIPESNFYEFIEITDDEPDLNNIKLLDELEVGKKYELVITNLSGFYRYRMKDVFLITGKYNNTPTIEYQYRTDKTVSLMGEKTTEIALRRAAEDTADECGFDLIDCSIYPDTDNTRYVYLMEIAKIPESLTKEALRDSLEENLAKANPSMGDKVKKGLCKPTEVLFLQPETYLLYRDLMLMKGYSVGQLKPVNVISNEMQRKFFFGLQEEFDELKKISPR